MPKVLYFSPVGSEPAKTLFKEVRAAFEPVTDFRLIVYDKTDYSDILGINLTYEQGYKWILAKTYLRPEAVAEYDYIAVWDDDIGIGDFNLFRFLSIMHHNKLNLAQPSIRSEHRFSHPIVEQQPNQIGRFTNFVEIMVPVFSRVGWQTFYPYLTNHNKSGWGYDYINIEPRGIIDEMHVVHTREVRSITKESERELDFICKRYGFSKYEELNLGMLSDPSLL